MAVNTEESKINVKQTDKPNMKDYTVQFAENLVCQPVKPDLKCQRAKS